MTAPLVISQFWADEATDAHDAINQLKSRILALDNLPKNVTLVSAGEVCILLDGAVTGFYLWLSERTHVTFISAACTSLHAGILDFYHSDLDSTLVISLELDKHFQQGCLNALGIGNDIDQDGLDVVPGVGFIAMHKGNEQPRKGDLVIEHCQLLSQGPGLTGTSSLVRQLYHELKDLPEHVLPVSFDICSQWGKSLWKGLDMRLEASQQVPDWLSSIERCQRHYLSLKPLFELQMYQQKLQNNSLLLLTLGGGGRVGMLQLGKSEQLGKNSTIGTNLPQASFETHCMSTDINGYELALALRQEDPSAYYQQIRTTLKYPRSRYRGMDNHYFKWQPAHDSHPTIAKSTSTRTTRKTRSGV
ncbi:MAG: hypothetical protein HRT35_12015 [Algicola sp.]|nr:hypothetical protein [Algicola sp.]